MLVDVFLTVKVADQDPQFRSTEQMLETEAVGIVRDAVAKESAIQLVGASLFSAEHCKALIGELGVLVSVGLPLPARIYQDGSWHYPDSDPRGAGNDFASLIQFVTSNRN